MIVTPEGLNVFPEDVERVFEGVPGVSETAVVWRRVNGAEHVHAVLVLRPGIDAAAVVREANAKLEKHQRVQDFSVWPEAALPRTEAIRKLKRHQIRQWVEEGAVRRGEAGPPPADDIERLLTKYVESRGMRPETVLDELGLTSLDRIELTIAPDELNRR